VTHTLMRPDTRQVVEGERDIALPRMGDPGPSQLRDQVNQEAMQPGSRLLDKGTVVPFIPDMARCTLGA
jgi:hypothetical protein